MKLWKHQEDAICESELIDYYGLFFEMGTGKTGTAINIARRKFARYGRLLRTLIISPPITLHNWKEEWLKFSKVKEESITILQDSGKKRYSDFMLKGHTDTAEKRGHIFITNYESLLMADLFQAMLKWQPELIILDESQKVKTYNSKRTKLAHKLGEKSTIRMILTGSPVTNSLMDMWSQIYFLDQGRHLPNNYFAFRGRYMRDKNAGMARDKYFPNFVPIVGAEEEIRKKISHFTKYQAKSECLDLPELVEIDHYVDMPPEAMRTYQEMKKDFITFLDGKECVATMALTKLLRLQQLASGFCRDVEGKDHEIEANPKLEALEELLDSIVVTQKAKVIIWAAWKANYASIRKVLEKMKIPYVELTGDTSPKKRQDNVEEFCKGKAMVCIAHPAAAGVGINLVEASYSIFYSRTFNLEHDLQASARNYRKGSEMHAKITRINLITKGTVDELVATKLKAKEEIGTKILIGIKEKI